MSDARQVILWEAPERVPSLYLYSHWGGASLAAKVSAALTSGQSRWNDPSYLSRIIFDHVTAEADPVTGVGLSISPTISDYDEDIHVMLESKRIRIGDVTWEYDEFAALSPAFARRL